MKTTALTLFAIIDDDADDRELLVTAVKEIAPDIATYSIDDPEKFLADVDKQNKLPDVIFLDVNMPRMNGYRFLECIRHDLRFLKTQIVMYSTTFESSERIKAKLLGADGFITKPNTFGELCGLLKSFIASICESNIHEISLSRKQINESHTVIKKANQELSKYSYLSALNGKGDSEA